MKFTTAIAILANLATLTVALPADTSSPADAPAANNNSEDPKPPVNLCDLGVTVRQAPLADMVQDHCWELAARKLWEPVGSWTVKPGDFQLLGEFKTCALYAKRDGGANTDTARIGGENIFWAIINASERFVEDKMMSAANGLMNCEGGPVRWVVRPKW